MINPKERTEWKGYKVGDIIDGSDLSKLSGDLEDGKRGDKYVLVQQSLSEYDYTKDEVLRLDAEDANDGEQSLRLDGVIENFDKTPPIPKEGDGMHRIVAAKELGHETILMWKPLKAVEQSLKETPQAEEIAPQKETIGKFSELTNFDQQLEDASTTAKKKQIEANRDKWLNENPSMKDIYSNAKEIIKQLEKEGLVTEKKGPCM